MDAQVSSEPAEEAPDREPWKFVRIVRQPSGFGVAYLTVRHRDKGSVAVPMTVSDLVRMAQEALVATDLAAQVQERAMTTAHFAGGPWDGQQVEMEQVVGPVFGVGHDFGNHYWLDTKSDPPTYHWIDPDPQQIDGGDHA